MPANRSILADITDHDLDPNQAHVKTNKAGRIVDTSSISVESVEKVEIATLVEEIKKENKKQEEPEQKVQVADVVEHPLTVAEPKEEPVVEAPVVSVEVTEEEPVKTEETPSDLGVAETSQEVTDAPTADKKKKRGKRDF